MENSSIALAHSHARNAVLETRRSNPVAASEEHDLAAVEFANAARSTADAEALRTLHLLEQHHKQLGHILKFRHQNPPLSEKSEDEVDSQEATATTKKVPEPTSVDTSKQSAAPEALQQPPRLAPGTRATARDLSSSIASNLASARGIPGSQKRGMPASPTLSAQHAPGKVAKDQAKTRETQKPSKYSKIRSDFFTSNDSSNGAKPSWAPPDHVTSSERSTAPPPAVESAASMNDVPFQQFYNTFESLMSKLSAPLAFAGLPLMSNATVATQQRKPAKPPDHVPAASETYPDYSQLISRAALRAVHDGQPSPTNAAESFYVVPSTGGTISYADIMTRADREASARRHTRHLSNMSEDNVEDFVDANETLPPAATNPQDTDQKPNHPSRFPRNMLPFSPAPATIHGKSLEELSIENASLKKATDNLCRRLHVFEASAQSSSAALAQSIRSMTARSNPSTPENSQGKKTPRIDDNDGDGGSNKAAGRIAELEDILRKSDRELARRERENAKLKETVGRYRERWEKLKEGARVRRDGGAGAAAGGTLAKGEDGSAGTNPVE